MSIDIKAAIKRMNNPNIAHIIHTYEYFCNNPQKLLLYVESGLFNVHKERRDTAVMSIHILQLANFAGIEPIMMSKRLSSSEAVFRALCSCRFIKPSRISNMEEILASCSKKIF